MNDRPDGAGRGTYSARGCVAEMAGDRLHRILAALSAGGDFHFAVHNAAGMVSVQEGISAAGALIRLRVLAFSDDRPLADMADDVVARRLRAGMSPAHPAQSDGDRPPQGWMCPVGPDGPPGVQEVS